MITTDILRYDADTLSMTGQICRDHALVGQRPGILVFPEAFGLGVHAKWRAERLAGLGYVALACDLHGNGLVIEDHDTVMKLIGPMRADPAGTRARAQGAFASLLRQPDVDPSRIGAVGYCFGGTMALELARSGAAVAGLVGLHAGLKTARPQDAGEIKGKVLICTGADDPAVPFEDRAAFESEMRAGDVDWQMHVYGGVRHSFTDKDAARIGRPDVARYDAQADARSWASMRAFFSELFEA